jgi:DNA-binding HxlR family transcriptional regulator
MPRGLATTIEYNGHQTTISVFDDDCPSRLTLELIADKWAVLVIAAIHEGANRNGAMLRHIHGISQKMLTQTLRGLESDGLISRTSFNEVPPRVEYALTPLGESLRPLVVALCRWAIANVDAVMTARTRFAETTSGS